MSLQDNALPSERRLLKKFGMRAFFSHVEDSDSGKLCPEPREIRRFHNERKRLDRYSCYLSKFILFDWGSKGSEFNI